MNVIDLGRLFVPLKPDGETIDWSATMGRKYGGWLTWDDLITRQRVVLLAEAKSGKTEEFRLQAAAVRERGKAGFFLRVEDLADGALFEGLTPEDEVLFRAWQDGNETGWFFLDSVDEARLNAKSFERALNRFRRDVGPALDRASVFISCRVSDWKGKQDLDLVTSLLPISPRRIEEEASSVEELLLGPMFKESSKLNTKDETGSDPKEPLMIVRLAELTMEQCSALAGWAGVADSNTFIREIGRQGLNTFAERPGDLLELAEYWKAHRRFASFAEMTEFAIGQKLAERESDRPDADVLTDVHAREGAERVAATLTLGKALTLRVLGQEPDPMLAAGALDPTDILPDWKPSERAALLRRGVFTPATYGRIRFHHRSTQEYLTAQWLRHALDNGCPRSEIMGLLFVEPYGVATVVPSMRPAAAWLALTDAEVRDELLEREPLELMRHGDPRSLPISARARLLTVYADRQGAGEVTDNSVDHRSFWMFSDPALAPTIREAWTRNTDPSFRTQLLSLVREGVIAECADLAREQAFDTAAESYFRYAAVAAMVACGDREGLLHLAHALMIDPSDISARDAANFARYLFPTYLSRSNLIRLIDQAQPADRTTREGFPSDIRELWGRCPQGERAAFLEELADLCLTPPLLDDYHRLSTKHRRLAPELAAPATEVALTLSGGPVPPGLIKACAAIERSEEYPDAAELQKLRDELRGRRDFHRELFWFDVQEARRNRKRDVTHFWQLGGVGLSLWELTVEDVEWLIARIRDETVLQDRRIALSAVIRLLGTEALHARADEFRAMVAGVPDLESAIAVALSPPPLELEPDEYVERNRIATQQRVEREMKAKQSWIDFAARIRADSSHLRDPIKLEDWAYAVDLQILTDWLSRKTGKSAGDAARRWPLLNEVFGDEVAEAYRAGMKLLWRLTVPHMEKRRDGESDALDRTDLLSFYGIGVEAEEGEGWADRLTADEAERAVLHAFSVGERSAEWIEALVQAHPDRVKPIIAQEVAAEWAATSGFSMGALNGIANGGDEYLLQMANLVIDHLRERPGRVEAFDIGLRVFARLPQTIAARDELIASAEHELRMNAADDEWALRQLALLFTCNTDVGVESLEWWLAAAETDEMRNTRGEKAFAALFSHRWPLVLNRLRGQPADTLKRLTLLAYRIVRPDDDVHHEGVYSPDRRDDAESARSRVLDALLDTPGRETYDALRELAEDPAITSRRKRFRELAHRRAENDAEMPTWSAADVLAFEKRHAAPAKSGGDLFRIACAILDDIQTSFIHGDASSRLVVASAAGEEAVQQWLAEQFTLRSNRRFHVHREVEVAERKEPDIVLSSTAATVEVAIEVKHSGKNWTVRDLENALRTQLAENYLRPANRRYGILVITYHSARTWRDSDNAVLDFTQVLERLSHLAATLNRNEIGAIQVAVIGLDASGSD